MELATLISRRDAYVAAEAKILQGQEYSIDVDGSSRRLRRADLQVVQATIRELNAEIAAKTPSTRRRVRYVNVVGR